MNFDYSYIDTAFINGKVITVNEKDAIEEAVGVKGNKIVFVGKTDELTKLISENTKVIDLQERTLMPGIIDAHFHPILNGFCENPIDAAMINIDASQCKSVKDILDLLSQALKNKKDGEWVSAMGYEPVLLKEMRHPTIEELDEIAPNNPIHCMHLGGHVCMYNSKALEYLGVYSAEDADKYPEGEVDVVDGKLTGLVRGHTHFALWAKVDYSEQQQERAAMNSQKLLLENGVTSIHDCGECDAPSYHIMQKLCREGKFKVRSYMMLHSIYGKPFSLEDNDHWLGLGLTSGLGDEHFRIGSCKFMIDGGAGAPSCATRKPYCSHPDLKGEIGWERKEVSDYILKIHRADCQATAHAIGDLAVEYMVEGYENAFKESPKPHLRHRIEHCTLTDQDLINRMAAMNICPTINTGMITQNGKHYYTIYGEERSRYFMALKSMIDAGIKVALASDAPSGPMGMHVLEGAVNRIDRNNGYAFSPNQCVSVIEAIRCMTYNGAYLSYEEDIKGSIEVGKLADLVILNQDLLMCQNERLSQVKVDMTMIDGVIEYERHST